MRSIGIRQLRQHASRHLRAVQSGETVQVTDRGKPVAMIVPVPAHSTLDDLEAAGRLSRAAVTDTDPLLAKPLAPRKGALLPSEALERIRSDER
jgi:prevent-host-death family protein